MGNTEQVAGANNQNTGAQTLAEQLPALRPIPVRRSPAFAQAKRHRAAVTHTGADLPPDERERLRRKHREALRELRSPMRELAQSYVTYLEGKSSPNTVNDFILTIRRFHYYVVAEAGRAPDETAFDPEVVLAFREYLCRQDLLLSSVRTNLQRIKGWATYLTEKAGVFDRNPLRGRDLLPGLTRESPLSLDDDVRREALIEVSKRDQTSQRDTCILVLSFDTGLRVSEVASIDIHRVDFEKREITVLGKGRKVRRVGFGEASETMLRRYISGERARYANHLSQGFLFVCQGEYNRKRISVSGQPMPTWRIKDVFRRLSKKLGRRITSHLVRHSFAHDYLEYAGASVAKLQAALGHSKPDQSMRYGAAFESEAVHTQRTASVSDAMLRRLGLTLQNPLESAASAVAPTVRLPGTQSREVAAPSVLTKGTEPTTKPVYSRPIYHPSQRGDQGPRTLPSAASRKASPAAGHPTCSFVRCWQGTADMPSCIPP